MSVRRIVEHAGLLISVFTAGLTVGLAAGVTSPAAAQGDPGGGTGNHSFLAGAGTSWCPATSVRDSVGDGRGVPVLPGRQPLALRHDGVLRGPGAGQAAL